MFRRRRDSLTKPGSPMPGHENWSYSSRESSGHKYGLAVDALDYRGGSHFAKCNLTRFEKCELEKPPPQPRVCKTVREKRINLVFCQRF